MIQWVFRKMKPAFMGGNIGIDQHLGTFQKNQAVLTTGGRTTYVKQGVGINAIILGPGKITPRTIAHEIGHLFGFADCYFRTMGAEMWGLGGQSVLEWSNPFFPDDLMCDNNVGVLRGEVW